MNATEVISKFIEKNPDSVAKKVAFMDGEIAIVRTISPQYANAIVKSVADGCIDENGEYNPMLKMFLLKLFCTMAYTDIELPEDTIDQYMFLYTTDVFDTYIAPEINAAQFREMKHAIEDLISYKIKVGTNAVTAGLIDAQVELRDALDKAKSVFDGVTNEEMKGLISAISGNKLDEEKLVKAITDSIVENKNG